MATIEHYDWRNISLRQTVEFERIWHEAISEDPLRLALFPSAFQFSPSHRPPISDYEALIRRAKHFRCIVETDARQFQIRIRSDPRAQIYMLKDDQGQYSAVCLWTLPKYLPEPRLPLLYRLKTWFLSRWYSLRNWWTWLGYPRPPTNVRAMLDEGRKLMGVVDDTSQRREELQQLSPKQLEDTTYPVDYTYHMLLFATRKSKHGHGYGKTLLKESLQALHPYVPPPHLEGPPKATLHASPPARGFYEKNGYSLGALYETKLPNGDVFPHTYYFRNLTPG